MYIIGEIVFIDEIVGDILPFIAVINTTIEDTAIRKHENDLPMSFILLLLHIHHVIIGGHHQTATTPKYLIHWTIYDCRKHSNFALPTHHTPQQHQQAQIFHIFFTRTLFYFIFKGGFFIKIFHFFLLNRAKYISV